MKKLLASFLYKLYRTRRRSVRGFIRNILTRMDGGEFYSVSLRSVFKHYHSVEIGMYTHGECFVPGAFDRHTSVGRYCSIAANVRTMNRNHPLELKSMHAFFFNNNLGYCSKDPVNYIPLSIGSDVWFGYGATIMPAVKSIGHGAVVAAGAVVNKNVPPYAVVVGNPARIVRYRFPKEVIEELLASCWWENDIEQLLPAMGEFQRPYAEMQGKRRNTDTKQTTQIAQ